MILRRTPGASVVQSPRASWPVRTSVLFACAPVCAETIELPPATRTTVKIAEMNTVDHGLLSRGRCWIRSPRDASSL